LARSHCDTQGAIAREATEIFGAAFTRLQALRDTEFTPAIRRSAGMKPDAVAMRQAFEAVSI
ncbi:MAG TPA: hypothetical protein VK642_16360, partial [Burkholderiales bacterium]|nr:hypothetical protein [Burkholderiales bacterium]